MARQEYCAQQLRRKLQQVAEDPDAVPALIARLQQQGYLSEQRFAESYLRSRIRRGETVQVAARRARQKGVEREALQAAVAEIDLDEGQACRQLLHKRDPEGLRFDDRRIWQRHLRYLCNKGYPMAIAMEAMQQRDLEQEGADNG